MLTLVVAWVVLLALCSTVGLCAMQLFRSELDQPGDRWIVAAWVGLALVGSILLLVSTVVALSPGAVAVVSTVLVVASLSSVSVRAKWAHAGRHFAGWALPAVALLVGLAALFTRPVTLYDTGAYHLGIIEWLSRFGSVPGVALIHARLSFGSSWFALDTAFNHGFLHGRTAGMLGGLAIMLALVHLGVAGVRCISRRAKPSDLFVLIGLAVVILSLSSDLMISPSPDVPAAILIVEGAWLLFKVFEAPGPDLRQSFVTGAVMLGGGAAGMKLSAFPFALMLLVLAVLLRASVKRVAALAGFALVFAGPTLVSNTVASGCPLFPSGPCVETQWALSSAERTQIRTDILDFGRGSLAIPPEERTSFNWIWREWLLAGGTTRTTVALLAVAGVIFAAAWFALRRWQRFSPGAMALLGGLILVAILCRRLPSILICLGALLAALAVWKARDPGSRIVGLIGLVGVGFVVYAGPLLRFGLGYVAISLAAFATMAHGRLGAPGAVQARSSSADSNGRWRLLGVGGGLVLAVIAVVYAPGFGKGFVADGDAEQVLVPPEVPDPPVERERARDFAYYVSLSAEQCWASELPCAQNPLPNDRRLRSPSEGIGGGFVRVR